MDPWHDKNGMTFFHGDALAVLKSLPDQSINCCVTSPPYFGLRDYGVDGQIGSEKTPREFVDRIVPVFAEVKRTMCDDGTLWLNLGDSYANDTKWGGRTGGKHPSGLHGTTGIGRSRHTTGLPGKNLLGMPWRVAFALQDDGWILRNEIIWHKPSVMPESCKDRCTRDHEHIFLFAKNSRYYFNQDLIKVPASPDTHARYARGRSNDHKYADGGPGNQTIAKSLDHMRKPGVNPKAALNAAGCRQNESFSSSISDVVEERNLRTVWSIATKPFPGAHFATFPPKLIEPCILAGCPEGGIVLDPFLGSGTTAAVSQSIGRKCVGIDLNESYLEMALNRIKQTVLF